MYKTIRGKVRAVLLLTALTPLVALGAVSLVSMYRMRAAAVSASDDMATTVASDSRAALMKRLYGEMAAVARDRAALVNEKLTEVMRHTLIVRAYAERLYADPAAYPPRPLGYLKPGQEGTPVPHVRTAAGVSYDGVYREIALLGNAQDALGQFVTTGISVTSSYIGTESGFFVVVDTMAAGPRRTDYDARTRDWYKGAVKNRGVFWTEIFADSSGRGAAVSCAAPVYAPDGTLKAVAGTGAFVERIGEIVKDTTIGETGYGFLLNEKGQVVITPKGVEIDENGGVVIRDLSRSADERVRALGASMTAGESGIREITLGGRQVYVAYSPLEVTGWSLGLVMPASEVLAPAAALEEKISALKTGAASYIASEIGLAAALLALITAAAGIVAAALSVWFAGKIARPIRELSSGVGKIAGGDFGVTIDIRTGDEIERLGASVNSMSRDLRAYMENIAKAAADKERAATELNVATRIQTGMLPHVFPAFPDRKEFDVYASMSPAKEVGGDFYDFFFVEGGGHGDTLAVVIADVSGKGVPAAMFMVIAKTLIRGNVQDGKSPRETFEAVNNLLCENNEAGMFVTAFMGYLDLTSGVFRYVNAGHNPPLLSQNGAFEFMTIRPGLVLAGMENMRYTEGTVTLRPGATLYLYTDGITEAENPAGEFFGNRRLIDAVNALAGTASGGRPPLDALALSVKRAVDAFAAGAEQSDDITMLALAYYGAAK